ncbi:hypothetical protein OAG20_03185 [Verrucomicrobiales bacterium]|jgi:hypothetical protein|nr:hypothetical protein [Verrucomicrobiales bacterium]
MQGILFATIGALTLSIIPVLSGPELTTKTFASWHQTLRPSKEAWTTIPWQVSLVPAQQLALKEGKPLFVWAMDGHPLGCT